MTVAQFGWSMVVWRLRLTCQVSEPSRVQKIKVRVREKDNEAKKGVNHAYF